MRTATVKVVSAADGITPTPHDGRYVVAWNPHTEAGTLELTSTDDRAQARHFQNGEEFTEWKTVSAVQPKRPWDGRPNRPLTAVNIEIEALTNPDWPAFLEERDRQVCGDDEGDAPPPPGLIAAGCIGYAARVVVP